ncbi:MAG: hypothetical protein QXX95_06755 [Nitrososphaerales archaeon]|jgi:hypothetical protein
MQKGNKLRSIQFIEQIKEINSDIQFEDAIWIEKELGEVDRKGKLMWTIVIASIFITIAFIVLIYLKSFGISHLNDKTILVLASGTALEIVGYTGIIVRYYWHRK